MKKEIHDNLAAFICFIIAIIATIISFILRIIGQKTYHLNTIFFDGLGSNLFYNDPLGISCIICSIIAGGLFAYCFCYIFSKYRKIVNFDKYVFFGICVLLYAVLLVSCSSLLFGLASLSGAFCGLFFAAKDSKLTEKEMEHYRLLKAAMMTNKTGVIHKARKDESDGH